MLNLQAKYNGSTGNVHQYIQRAYARHMPHRLRHHLTEINPMVLMMAYAGHARSQQGRVPQESTERAKMLRMGIYPAYAYSPLPPTDVGEAKQA